MSAISNAFEKEVKAAFVKEERRMLILGVRVAYQIIMREWPVWSGYSKANNRISITGRPIRKLEPSKRPLIKGALAGKARQVEASEITKLQRLTKNFGFRNRKITIGNSVSYSGDVSFTSGFGRAIYERAARQAESIIKAARS